MIYYYKKYRFQMRKIIKKLVDKLGYNITRINNNIFKGTQFGADVYYFNKFYYKIQKTNNES